ncbi:MAG: phage holin family protein [Candidatus Limnocylindrales bacterium]
MKAFRRVIDFYRLEATLLWRWRPGRWALVRRFIASFVILALSLTIASTVLGGFSIDGLGALVASVLVIGVLSAVVRPLLLVVFAQFSVVLVGIASILFQVLVLMLLVPLVPGVTVRGFGAAFIASWVVAIVSVILSSLFSVGHDDSFYGTLVRQLAATREDAIHTDVPAVVIVQIDGLARPILASQIRAGRVPVISRWVRSGTMRLDGWTALLPSQTSASQAGILHGNNDDIPAFRWWDKAGARMMVSNHPADAAEIVRHASNGEGLLADDGASVGNLCSGDAVRSYLTMATIKDPKQGLGRSQSYFSFFLSPSAYLHTIVLTVTEALKEVFQARRSRQAGVEPNMDRGFPYPVVRAATNVVLRDLSTSLVVEEMMRGTPVIYIDFTDYDEIAHHSGPERSETLDALDGVDQALGTLEKAALDAPRPYRFVVLSDHGQSLGATFRQRYGVTLEEVLHQAMGASSTVSAATGNVEVWGGMTSLLSEAGKAGGATGAVTRAAFGNDTVDGVVEAGAAQRQATKEAKTAGASDLVVCASGNLGLAYFPEFPGRATGAQIETRYPRLIETLAAHPGVGLVMVRTDEGPVAIGARGQRSLVGGRVVGSDPTEPYGPFAVQGLLRVDSMANCGDLMVISLLDPQTDEVAAFEELIGSHGGLGGWQTEPFILHPAEWTIDGPIIGAPAVYQQLRRWLGQLGIGPERVAASRRAATTVETAAPSAAGTATTTPIA